MNSLKLNLSKHRPGAPPWPAAIALTVAITLAHFWILMQGPTALGSGARQHLTPKLSISTRSITSAAGQTPPGSAPRLAGAQAPTASNASALAMEPSGEPGIASSPKPSPKAEGSTDAGQAHAATAAASGTVTPHPTPDVPSKAESALAASRTHASAPSHEGSEAATPAPAAKGSTAADPAADGRRPETVDTKPHGAMQAAAERAPALAIPDSAKLSYQLSGRVRGLDYTAHGQMDWQQDGQRYQAKLTISMLLLPSRSQSSVGEIGPEGLSPRRFSDRSRGESAIHFQPELGRITFSNNSPPSQWLAGTQDRLSLSMQLAAMIAGDPTRFTTGSTVSIPTAGTRSVDPWDFTVMGNENQSLPIGTQGTLRLKREPRHQYDQTIEIWFAPALGYLPVRIRLSQGNGDVVDQRLAGIERP